MPTFSASVSRSSLSLSDLNINDHLNYYVSSDSILGGTVSMRRNTVTSPHVASGITVSAVPDLVQDTLGVEVLANGGGAAGLQANLQALIQAFQQDNFNFTWQWDSAVYTYSCQPCDYSWDWTGGRPFSSQILVKFALYRSPIAINGV